MELWEQLNALRMVVETLLNVTHSREPDLVHEVARTLERNLASVRARDQPGDEATLQMAIDLVNSTVE